MKIETYTGKEISQIIQLWNDEMPRNPITQEMFVKNILLDLNFTPEGFFLAWDKDELVGFVYTVIRRIPVDVNGELDLDKGWICALAVKNGDLSIGTALIQTAETYLNKDGKRKIYACSYTPNYFYQGINVQYENYLELFHQMGYGEYERSVSMKLVLKDYKTPPGISDLRKRLADEGITFCDLTPPYIHSWLTFQKPSWTHRFRRLLNETGLFENITIALYEDKVIGCNIFGDPYSNEERFGPFGVSNDFQGKGIGKVLLDECMLKMKARGLSHAWMQWATAAEYVVNLYLKFGFEIMDTYVIFEK